MTRDDTEQIAEFWPTIMQAWGEHGDKHPIIECDVVRGKVVLLITLSDSKYAYFSQII